MRNWSLFLLCFLLSASIWLIYNLSRTHSSIVSAEVAAASNIEGRAERSSDAVTMAARVSASGFRLLRINLRNSAVVVRFAPEDLHRGEADYFGITANELMRYGADIFGAGTKVEAFLFDEVSFRFIAENHKKVPIRPVALLDFRSQYAQVSELGLTPDSVMIYGPAEILERVDEVYTSTISMNDIHSNVHGEVGLETPGGTRLAYKKADFSFDVSRYVEIRSEVAIAARNVPGGLALRVHPSKAVLTFKSVFPLINDPVGAVGAYVDYNEFATSLTGRCMVRYDRLPKGIISCTVEPAVVECVEQELN